MRKTCFRPFEFWTLTWSTDFDAKEPRKMSQISNIFKINIYFVRFWATLTNDTIWAKKSNLLRITEDTFLYNFWASLAFDPWPKTWNTGLKTQHWLNSLQKSQNCTRCGIMLVSILFSYSKDLEEALPLIEKYQEKLVAIGEVSV